jgi:acyl-CoA reductase-like NAD-dependent aldehyde dehydrogenase
VWSLLVDPPPGSRVRQEEAFGPTLSVIRVDDADKAADDQ